MNDRILWAMICIVFAIVGFFGGMFPLIMWWVR